MLCGGPPCQGFSGMNLFNSREYSPSQLLRLLQTSIFPPGKRQEFRLLQEEHGAQVDLEVPAEDGLPVHVWCPAGRPVWSAPDPQESYHPGCRSRREVCLTTLSPPTALALVGCSSPSWWTTRRSGGGVACIGDCIGEI